MQTLNQLEEANKPIFWAHMPKDALAAILDGRPINVARRPLKMWVKDAPGSGLKPFVRLEATIQKRMNGMLEYDRARLSNGRTEGMNSKIRTITGRSYGLHSAGALIAMIFLCCGGVFV